MEKITLFACPKAFKGHIALIQRNAIMSWTQLQPRPDIILLCEEEGTEAFCRELGLQYVPDIARNKYGTPLDNDIFEKAQAKARTDLVCYVNADAILLSDFMKAIECLENYTRPFLMSSAAWGLDIRETIDFDDPDWEVQLLQKIKEEGVLWFFGNEYLLFRRGFYKNIPPLAIGRGWNESWYFWKAKNSGAAVIDATQMVQPIYQHHEYPSWMGEAAAKRETSAEGKRNFELANIPVIGRCSLVDATQKLSPRGLQKIFFRKQRYWIRLKIWDPLVYQTGPIRHALKIRRSSLSKLKTWFFRKTE